MQATEKRRVLIANRREWEEALEIVRTQTIAVILCDQRMPELSGSEVLAECAIIQPDAVRIVLSGYTDLNGVIEAVNEGQISHFLLKPWSVNTLRRVIREGVERFMLAEEKERMAMLKQEYQKALEAQQESLINAAEAQSELLHAGWSIQQQLLIDTFPKNINDIQACCCVFPAEDLSGDFVFFHRYNENCFDMAIGDVMGHGLSPALQAAALRAEFAYECGIAVERGVDNYAPADMVFGITQRFSSQLQSMDSFSSLFFARINTKEKTLRYVAYGSAAPILVSNQNEVSVEYLCNDHSFLGVEPNTKRPKENMRKLNLGDVLCLYSDGVVEAESKTTEPFSTRRLEQILLDDKTMQPNKLVNSIISEIHNHTGRLSLPDDFTCVIFNFSKGETHSSDAPVIRNDETSFVLSTGSAGGRDVEILGDYVKEKLSQCKNLSSDEVKQGLIILAVHEAYTNIVRHAYGNRENMPVHIHIHQHKTHLDIELLDYGVRFDPELVPQPDFSGESEGGFGVYIQRTVATSMHYDQDEQARNRMLLTFDYSTLQGENNDNE